MVGAAFKYTSPNQQQWPLAFAFSSVFILLLWISLSSLTEGLAPAGIWAGHLAYFPSAPDTGEIQQARNVTAFNFCQFSWICATLLTNIGLTHGQKESFNQLTLIFLKCKVVQFCSYEPFFASFIHNFFVTVRKSLTASDMSPSSPAVRQR